MHYRRTRPKLRKLLACRKGSSPPGLAETVVGEIDQLLAPLLCLLASAQRMTLDIAMLRARG